MPHKYINYMYRLKFVFAAMLMLLTFGLHAQQSSGGSKYAQIKGRVVEDALKGEPVGFATVYIMPQDIYTATDIDGNF